MIDHEYLGMDDSRTRLKGQVLLLMLRGAGYAAIFSLGVVLFVLFFYWLGGFLPPESKEAPDPSLGSVLSDPAARDSRLA